MMNGKICTFFGHRDCPASIRSSLRAVLISLIETEGVTSFFVGNQGAFDAAAQSVLRDLQSQYPDITCTVVFAYMPRKPEPYGLATMLPEGIEKVPKRFAISWRNRWMLDHADCVVTYVTHAWGGAAQFATRARKQGKRVYPLGEESVGYPQALT